MIAVVTTPVPETLFDSVARYVAPLVLLVPFLFTLGSQSLVLLLLLLPLSALGSWRVAR